MIGSPVRSVPATNIEIPSGIDVISHTSLGLADAAAGAELEVRPLGIRRPDDAEGCKKKTDEGATNSHVLTPASIDAMR